MAEIYTNTTKRILNLGGAIKVNPGQFQVDGKLARRLKKSPLFQSYLSDLSVVPGNPNPEEFAQMVEKRKSDLAAVSAKAMAKAKAGKVKADMSKPAGTNDDTKTKLTAGKPKAAENAS